MGCCYWSSQTTANELVYYVHGGKQPINHSYYVYRNDGFQSYQNFVELWSRSILIETTLDLLYYSWFICSVSKQFEGNQAFIQKLVFVVANIALICLAAYKCHSMGLLPLYKSDWVDFLDIRKVLACIVVNYTNTSVTCCLPHCYRGWSIQQEAFFLEVSNSIFIW